VTERVLERLGSVVLSVLLLVAGCFVLYLAVVWRWVDCYAESSSRCSPFSNYQIYASIGGLVAGAIALLESLRERGRPVIWLVAALGVYALWGYLVDRMVHG
jgi:hypothetical protein